MRGTIEGLVTPLPLAADPPRNAARGRRWPVDMCESLDVVLAPVLLSLDGFPAYLDLGTTPEDMLPWLAQWVGMTVDPGEDLDRQRELIATASELHAVRGTRRGIELAVEAALGVPAEVVETGAASLVGDRGRRAPG